MKTSLLIFITNTFLAVTTVHGFVPTSKHSVNSYPLTSPSLSPITSKKLRGGSDKNFMISNKMMIDTITTLDAALKSGPYGVLSLTGIASLVVVPLTLYRQGYSFSVGYGFSVLAMGYAIVRAFNIDIVRGVISIDALSLLACVVMFYGARLATYLLIREWTVPSRSLKQYDKTPRLKRIPFSVAVSMFYAFMTCPLMYAARSVSELTLAGKKAMNVGVGLALLGAVMEAIADGQKYLIKQSNLSKKDMFVGPTGGFYRLCRHPNYFGELLYWFGLFVAGMPSFGKSPIAWICSSLGMYGILGIMKGASKRLNTKQDENYKGQDNYENYKKEVPAALWPWMRN